MKVLIVLALAIAVASAAFSGSVLQQNKPLLDQARMSMQLAVARNVRVRNSAEVGFAQSLINGIMEQAGQIMDQINAGVQVVGALAEHLQTNIESALGELSGLSANAWEAAQNIIGNALNNLFSGLGLNTRSSITITPEMQSLMNMVLSNPTFVSLFRSEPMYLCLKDQGITIDHAHMQALNQANQLNANLLNKPEVAHCIQEVGGLSVVLSTSSTIKWLRALAESLGLKPLIISVINQLFPEHAAQIIGLLQQNTRGIWDGLSNLWDSITGGVSQALSQAWEAVSNGAAGAWDSVVGIINQIYEAAADKFAAIQQSVTSMLTATVADLSTMGLAQAQQFINLASGFSAQLGTQWDALVAQFTEAFGNNIIIPGKF